MSKKHHWQNMGSLQWGELGLPYERAETKYRCRLCGVEFTHYYHKEPNIYKAMEDAGYPLNSCTFNGIK